MEKAKSSRIEAMQNEVRGARTAVLRLFLGLVDAGIVPVEKAHDILDGFTQDLPDSQLRAAVAQLDVVLAAVSAESDQPGYSG